jgi:hypothetical protein
MAPTTTIFVFGPQLLYFSTDFQTKTCFGSIILKAIHFHLLDDFYFQNGRNIQDGVFQIFYDFLQALEFLIVIY